MKQRNAEGSNLRGLRAMGMLCCGTMLARMCAAPACAESLTGLSGFINNNYAQTLGILPTLVILALMAVIVSVDRYIRPGLKRSMTVIVALLFSLVAQNYLEYRMALGEPRWLARTLLSIYGYAVRPTILALFMKVIAPHKRFRWAWALVAVNAAVNATALFSHICFWIDEDNKYVGVR